MGALGLLIILGFYAFGEVCSRTLHIPIPGSVLGMIFFATALRFKIIAEERVQETTHFITSHILLFLIAPGSGVMMLAGTIAEAWKPILGVLVIATFAVLAVAGIIAEKLRHREDSFHEQQSAENV